MIRFINKLFIMLWEYEMLLYSAQERNVICKLVIFAHVITFWTNQSLIIFLLKISWYREVMLHVLLFCRSAGQITMLLPHTYRPFLKSHHSKPKFQSGLNRSRFTFNVKIPPYYSLLTNVFPLKRCIFLHNPLKKKKINVYL